MPLRLDGLHTAIVTPFTHSLAIDKDAYESHIRRQIEDGVNGLVVCGTTGESPSFSDEEFEYLIRTAVTVSDGNCRIIAGSGANSTQKTLHRSKIAEREGADALLIVAPYYNKPTQQGIAAHYTTIADSVEISLMIYNVPGRTSVNITPDTIARLAEHDNINSVKEASGDMNQIMDIIQKVPDDFAVLSGDDAMTLPLIAAGGQGVVSVAANEAPRLMKNYVEACLNSNTKKAQELHYKLLPLMRANFWQSNPIPVKAALGMMGHMENILRLPMVPLDEELVSKLKTVLNDLDLL